MSPQQFDTCHIKDTQMEKYGLPLFWTNTPGAAPCTQLTCNMS